MDLIRDQSRNDLFGLNFLKILMRDTKDLNALM